MKKIYKLTLGFFVLIASLFFTNGKTEAKFENTERQLIKETKKSTPLILYHAKDLKTETQTQLAWHYSHRSHYSHGSHYSHQSHYSHYSWWR